MIKALKYKLYQTKKNKKLISEIELASEIYNHCIRIHKLYYVLFKQHLSCYNLQKHITKLKKFKKYEHWSQLNSQAIQDITERIDRAYKMFFKKHNLRSPDFKSRFKYKSFTLKQTGYKFFNHNSIRLGKHNFRFYKSRDIPETIKTITIKRDSLGDLYIFIICDVAETEVFSKTGKTAGFDFGLKTYLTTSDNEEIQSPQFLLKSLSELKKRSRKLSKKKKGSNQRHKARLSLARLYRKIENQRHDFHFKLARTLCRKYDVMCFEDLNMQGMKKLWGRKISDLAFSEFLNILEYYALKTGKEVIKIDRFYPSSKTCSECKFVNKDLKLEDRVWECSSCGNINERDYNAALNIKRVGASTLKRDRIRLVKKSKDLKQASVDCILESHEL